MPRRCRARCAQSNSSRTLPNSKLVRQLYRSLSAEEIAGCSVGGGLWRGQRRDRGRLSFGEMEFLLFVLELVEAVVDAALGEQLLMGALFAEAAFVEDEDAVGVLDGAESMRDDERGAAAEEAAERFANLKFGFGVHARSGFVEDKEARIVREGAGEIDELALADAER